MKPKAIKAAKDLVKTRQNYTCEKCGKSRDASGIQMHGSHILPVTWAKTAADPNNILCLCAGCHKTKRDSWHEDPIANGRWFEERWPGRYDELYAQALAYSQNPFPKIDWKLLHEELTQQLKELPR